MTPAPDLFASAPPSPYERGPHMDSAGRFVHWCQHPGCRRWGSHGRGGSFTAYQAAVAARKDPRPERLLGEWHCAEHHRRSEP